eukprot:1211130-Pyramimonas_sp.AAC.1
MQEPACSTWQPGPAFPSRPLGPTRPICPCGSATCVLFLAPPAANLYRAPSSSLPIAPIFYPSYLPLPSRLHEVYFA